MSDETKEKVAAASRGRIHSEASKEKIRKANASREIQEMRMSRKAAKEAEIERLMATYSPSRKMLA
jgi:hypothetical protein